MTDHKRLEKIRLLHMDYQHRQENPNADYLLSLVDILRAEAKAAFSEGETKQAILEVQGRERFVEELKAEYAAEAKAARRKALEEAIKKAKSCAHRPMHCHETVKVIVREIRALMKEGNDEVG